MDRPTGTEFFGPFLLGAGELHTIIGRRLAARPVSTISGRCYGVLEDIRHSGALFHECIFRQNHVQIMTSLQNVMRRLDMCGCNCGT